MKRSVVIFIFMFFAIAMGFAQSGRQLRPMYRLDGGDFRNTGWFFGPGMTYTIPGAKNDDAVLFQQLDDTIDTLLIGSSEPKGKIGAYFEVGKFHFFKNPVLLDYMDFGLHYKMLRGAEDFSGTWFSEEGPIIEFQNERYFNRHQVGAFFNAYKIVQTTDNTFLQFGLGANLDYAVSQKRTSSIEGVPLTPVEKNFYGQFHAKIGFGYKAERGVFIVPSIETPILTAFPFDDGKS
ncbi:MAG: hypothetical protein AAF193_03005, partial [Bacteroidota bacterium]